MKFTVVKKGLYYDSVKLMLVTNKLLEIDSIKNIAVVMGTDLNKDTLIRNHLYSEDAEKATKNDLIIAMDTDSLESFESALKIIDSELNSRSNDNSEEEVYLSLNSAIKDYNQSNFCIISVPGEYAAEETENALDKNLNVMLFSDNVSVEDEIRLKKYAVSKNLLLMGPDCGTAHISGVPFCFSNHLRKGVIGLVAASGTGCQEVMTIVDKLGGGISNAIGTGGRDLSEKVGGIMTKYALQLLERDSDTKVIGLVSKPPSEQVKLELMTFIEDNLTKPVIIHFVGNDELIENQKIELATSLEEEAHLLVKKAYPSLATKSLHSELKENQKLLHYDVVGLFTGGTLAYEALYKLKDKIEDLHSNLKKDFHYESLNLDSGNIILDLGDDFYTRGRAHPMIDPTLRNEMFQSVISKDNKLILLDFVLGYGSNREPHKKIKELLAAKSNNSVVLATICGTYKDPQNYEKIRTDLENLGVLVFDSNASMVDYVISSIK